jgi:SMI1-KNR4 cell-wall
MRNDKYNILVIRAKEVGLCKPLTMEEINNVEQELNITLPIDFKKINLNCSYEFLGSFEFYNFGRKDDGVIPETKALREIYNLSNEYIILSQNGASAIFMKIISSEEAQVIWCDEMDGMNLLEGQPMQYNPTIFNSFSEFYEFLLDREEENRAEQGS